LWRRGRGLTRESALIIAIIVFVLLAVVFPALTVKKDGNKPTGDPATDIEFNISKLSESEDIMVWIDGDLTKMPMEEYLVGVIAAEMPASYELEALKAQAVAARTYTKYKKEHGGCSAHTGADICCDSAHCQAYITAEEMAKNWGSDSSMYIQKIVTAVNETSGEMIYYDGEEIQVFFHASSGGRTENSENVYPEALPYLVSVESEGEESSSHYYGEIKVSKNNFIKKMKAFSPSISFDGHALIGNVTRFKSGRVQSIEVGSETFTGREIRSVFDLNSTNFTIKEGDEITFSTIGFGHGVGMSQTGANAMAKKGADYLEILTHYFTGVTIK
jgi:stage II sporulation protein D